MQPRPYYLISILYAKSRFAVITVELQLVNATGNEIVYLSV